VSVPLSRPLPAVVVTSLHPAGGHKNQDQPVSQLSWTIRVYLWEGAFDSSLLSHPDITKRSFTPHHCFSNSAVHRHRKYRECRSAASVCIPPANMVSARPSVPRCVHTGQRCCSWLPAPQVDTRRSHGRARLAARYDYTQLVELSYIASNACSLPINTSTPSVSVTSPNTVAR